MEFRLLKRYRPEFSKCVNCGATGTLKKYRSRGLKDKIAKVIIMVLIVNYFQRVLHTKYETPLELLYFALAITALAVGLYFLGKVGKK